MKLSIRYADKIVGLLIIAALGILIFVIFMLGSSQRWFSRDYYFVSYFSSATGLSRNMAIQHRGFTIGHVKSVELVADDRVEVRFAIFDTYINRVTNGSLVEVAVSPLAALGGNSFNFYPGAGTELLNEGDVIPTVNSAEGRQLIRLGLAVLPAQDDGLSTIMSNVGVLLGNLNDLSADLTVISSDLIDAFAGTDRTSLGRIIGGAEGTLAGLSELPGDITLAIDNIVKQLDPILKNLEEISTKAADPDETIMTILDAEGDVYTELVKTLSGLSGTLQNLEKTTSILPVQLAVLLAGLNATLKTVEDVLIAVTNNPLLRGGMPERREINAGGTHVRDIEF
jgi:phospholipid/cholesterol/gamma-HCH transport system substrate-binding protein